MCQGAFPLQDLLASSGTGWIPVHAGRKTVFRGGALCFLYIKDFLPDTCLWLLPWSSEDWNQTVLVGEAGMSLVWVSFGQLEGE